MTHLWGCTCKECTRVDVHCPKCGKGYGKGQCYECPACMHEWNEGDELGYQVRNAEFASFDRNLSQIHADGVRLGVLK